MAAPGFLSADAARYLRREIVRETPLLARIRETCAARGLPNVPPETGSALKLLAAATGARRVLEVGTLLGYSGLWLLHGMGPGGRLDTIEIDEANADEAEANFREARVIERVTIHRGDALDVLDALADRGAGPFDILFLDADKEGYLDYLERGLPLLRDGGLVLADNMFWLGRAWDPAATDDATLGVRRFTKGALASASLDFTILPVGDGLGAGVVRAAGPR